MGIPLTRVSDSATTAYMNTFITLIQVTVRAPSVRTADVFGTGILKLTASAIKVTL